MLWLWVACPRSVPPALELDPEPGAVADPEPGDPEGRVAWIVGNDPLVRRPRLPTGPVPADLAAGMALLSGPAALAQTWWQLETGATGTRAVAFARGARLAALETALGDPAAALAWVVPLAAGTVETGARPALAWLGTEAPEALLSIVERQVVLGWLDGSGIDAGPAARALESPAYDRLSRTPAGRLLVARGRGAVDAVARAEGTAALEEATWLAAMEVAADRDAEQAALKQIQADVPPLETLLDTAGSRLTADAGTVSSVGGALVAHAALRWYDACPDRPCGGLDRVAAMGTAARWEQPALADAWRVIALKGATDRLEVAYDRVSAADAMVGVAEALLGIGSGGFDRSILTRPRPDATTNLALCRAAGGGDLTGREDLFHALHRHIAELATAAIAQVSPKIREPLERIASRAR